MPGIDILLVYPKPSRDTPVNLTPLSILFPGTLFESQGLSVAYFDARFDPPEELDRLILDAREIGVSAMTGFQCGEASRILKQAKALNPAIVTGVGGPHAILQSDQIRAEPHVDRVWADPCYGEHLFCYNEKTGKHFMRTEMQYLTSRGCPYGCTFCALNRSQWVPRPIATLDYELRTMHAAIGFDTISFCDPNIGHDIYFENGERKRTDRIERMRELGAILRDLGVRWSGNMRAPYLTEECVDVLAWSGCYDLEIGCESGDDAFLRKVIRKGHGVDAIKQAVLNVRGSGISLMCSFMAHMPGETRQMIHRTMDLIDWIKDTDPQTRVSIYSYAPYPGREMYDNAVRGFGGDKPFLPPETMEGWGRIRLTQKPIYWIAGLCFRKEMSRKNFPGPDWELIRPYIDLAEAKWRKRDIDDFPCRQVEALIQEQVEKGYRRTIEQSLKRRDRDTQAAGAAYS